MVLSLLLIFLKTLDNINLKDYEKIPQSFDDHQLKDGQLPPLVPLEFPAEMYENEAIDAVEVIKKKLENFFGETMTEEVMKIGSSDGVFDYLSKADFHSYWINGIINNVGSTLKSKETPLIGIDSKKKCRKVCRKNQSGIMKYLQTSIQNVINSMTKEDFRFEFSQDPKKNFNFTLDPETNTYQCKCTDKGYIVKVSPRFKQLMEEKFLKSGKSLSEIILEEDQKSNLQHFNDLFTWRKVTNLGLYLSGWKSRGVQEEAGNIAHFFLLHGFISLFLFVCCHCLFYFYVVYVFYLFLNNYVFT